MLGWEVVDLKVLGCGVLGGLVGKDLEEDIVYLLEFGLCFMVVGDGLFL